MYTYEARGVYVSGNHAYVADDAGLKIIDIQKTLECYQALHSGSKETVTLTVTNGWNLLSVPVNGTQSVENLGNFTILWKYLKDNDRWAVWSPDEDVMEIIENYVNAGTYELAEEVKPGEGFWILSSGNYTLEFEGESYGIDALSLTKGWNLAGAGKPFTVEEMKNYSVKLIWKYKDGKWYAWSPDGNIMKVINSYAENGTIGVIDKIDSGEGFWVKIQ